MRAELTGVIANRGWGKWDTRAQLLTQLWVSCAWDCLRKNYAQMNFCFTSTLLSRNAALPSLFANDTETRSPSIFLPKSGNLRWRGSSWIINAISLLLRSFVSVNLCIGWKHQKKRKTWSQSFRENRKSFDQFYRLWVKYLQLGIAMNFWWIINLRGPRL